MKGDRFIWLIWIEIFLIWIGGAIAMPNEDIWYVRRGFEPKFLGKYIYETFIHADARK